MSKFLLKEAFNQYLHSGCRTHTKREILVYGDRDLQRIEACLEDWKTRGYVEILKPLEEAQDPDIVVKVVDYIDAKRN